MNIPKEFDDIRPYEPEELQAAYDRIVNEPGFRHAVSTLFPGVPYEALAAKLKSCKTNLDFQKTFCYGPIKGIIQNLGDGGEMDASAIDNTRRYTFVSNHRDIVMDSAFLDVLLLDAGFTNTVEIAIGDNLFAEKWIEDLVRINKAFIVQRNLSMREMLVSSARLGRYMHFAVQEKNENIWIAQREGRAKDSDDRTQTSILKMMCMGGEGSIPERLQQLHIVPLTISYEYDPCDYLKAQEYQLKRDVPGWKKTKADDVLSMRTGIMGYKGHIHYHCAPCLDEWLGTLDAKMPKSELFEVIAHHLDTEIHRNYMLKPGNYVALDLLHGTGSHTDMYTDADKTKFEKYLTGQLDKITIPDKDLTYLRQRILLMYANPVINYLAAI